MNQEMNQDTHCGLTLSPKAIKDGDRIELDIHNTDLILKKLHVMKETTVGRVLKQKALPNLVGATIGLGWSANVAPSFEDSTH